MVVVIILIALIVVVAVYSILMGSKPKKEQAQMKRKLFKKAYNVLSRFFITQGSMRKIYSKISNLSVYRRDEMYELTVKYFALSWGVSLGMALFGIIMFDNIISILLCCAFALVLNTTLVDKQLDKQYFTVLQAISKALGAIRQEYMKTSSVVEAINDAPLDDILKKPFDEIYTILTSTDAELKLSEFYSATPFRPLQTLVGICYNINNQGDTKDEKGGSNFVSALTTLSQDVNAEITKITTQKQKFGIIEYLTIIPMFCFNFVESYFTGIMPGTALIYGGVIGYICKALTILLSMICYKVITSINTTVPVKEDDRVIWAVNAYANPIVKNFIDNLKPKNRKAVKYKQTLKLALSRQSIEEMYIQKVVYFFACFIVAIFTCLIVVNMGGEYVKNSTQQLSLVATDEMEKFTKESILQLDYKYIAQRDALQPTPTLKEEIGQIVAKVKGMIGLGAKVEKGEKYPDLSDDAIASMVQGYMPGLSDLQVLDQVSRLRDKYESIKGATFKWWMIWICFVIGLIGWKVPEIQIKLRRIMVKTDAEDDFLQLQTLVGIFMTTDMDTLDILYELSQHSRIHKDMLTYCYHAYPSNPEKELVRLQAKTPLVEFKRFIGKLELTISELSMQEAFSDLIIEREQIMRIREITIQSTISKKRGLCGPISLVPIGCMVIGELLVPLGYLGYREFMSALSSMD